MPLEPHAPGLSDATPTVGKHAGMLAARCMRDVCCFHAKLVARCKRAGGGMLRQFGAALRGGKVVLSHAAGRRQANGRWLEVAFWLTCMLLRSGAGCLQRGHWYRAWPAFPPSRSSRPSFPPPLFVVAAAVFMAISFAVCLAGLALPMLTYVSFNFSCAFARREPARRRLTPDKGATKATKRAEESPEPKPPRPSMVLSGQASSLELLGAR